MDLRINIIVKLIKQYFFRGKGTIIIWNSQEFWPKNQFCLNFSLNGLFFAMSDRMFVLCISYVYRR